MIKQIIVMRRDLKMRRGKEIAQGAHASMKFLCHKIDTGPPMIFSDAEESWLEGSFAKICVRVDSEEELLAIHEKAREAGLVSFLVRDAGKTEFAGVPTYTCLAIGPDTEERIDKITGELKLY